MGYCEVHSKLKVNFSLFLVEGKSVYAVVSGWILVSVSGSHFVKVQPGEDVTLNSSIMTTADSVKVWFRLDNRNMTNCIAIMINKDPSVNYCEGNPNGTFKMSLTTSTVSLQIKKVNSSDSGWYFCVFYTNTFLFNVTYLHVNGTSDFKEEVKDQKTWDDSIKFCIGLRSGLSALLLIIIVGLVVEIKKLQKAVDENKDPRQKENLDSDYLNHSSVTFKRNTRR
ncbi:uncharacterized protein LOC112449767 [Kryptolebias marmoratus]|uniref:uncharacterized protein LOC112449767 n=1 Tax=Kryptolebias marmoratus TaxID=37003 RepID=UPI0018ACB3F2|nr:uncharacterized protein LOC112449767 [Kryptolebias marmoratus]